MDRDFLVLFLGVDLPACVSEWSFFGGFRINCHYRDWVPLLALNHTTASSSTSSTHSTATTRRTKLFVLWCLYTNQYNKYKQQSWWFHTFFYFHPYELDDDGLMSWGCELHLLEWCHLGGCGDLAHGWRQMRVEHHVYLAAKGNSIHLVTRDSLDLVKISQIRFFSVLGFDVCMLLCRMFDTISMGLSHRRLMTGFRTIHIYGFVWHCSAPWKMGRQGHFPRTLDNSFTHTWYFTYINLKSLNEYEKVKLVIFPV